MTVTNTQGPGCTTGPGCCCDPCLTDHIDCLGNCCRCVPRVFEVIFTPNVGSQCSRFALFMHHGNNGSYSASLDGLFGTSDALLLLSLYRDEYLDECYWRLSIFDLGIDDYIYIDRTYVTCQSPVFTLDITTTYCSGTLSIARYDLEKVPFIGTHSTLDPIEESITTPCSESQEYEWYPAPVFDWLAVAPFAPGTCCRTSAPAIPADVTTPGQRVTVTCTSSTGQCGSCSSVCNRLCVQYTFGGVLVRKEFSWDAAGRRWIYSLNHIDDVILLQEDEYGICHMVFDIDELTAAGHTFQQYEPVECAIGMDFQILSDTHSILLSVSCNQCTCWDYICGSCRCACNTLCLLIYRNGVLQLLELPWYFDTTTNGAGWSDGYNTVELYKDVYTNECQVILDGFDAVTLTSCGDEIQFSVSNDLGDVAFGGCKKGLCFAPPATCCDRVIADLPLMLVATIVSTELCGCAGSTVNLIWNPFAEWWQGTGSLGGCYYDSEIKITVSCGGTSLVGIINYITCGTDGVGGSILYDAPPVTNGPVTCDPISFTLGSVTIDRSCCDDEPMAGGTIEITITE